ncbi:MAG: AAA family ATPase, partial [Pseudomonadota bacterium]
MSKPFFLTRQTANLMEDFTRELKSVSSLYLLYGDPRVGKTRLLEELAQSRLADKTLHWIDMASTENDDSLSDRSREIEEIFERANPGDIIIADHFEEALKKPRHQLFLSWSTDGVDKQLNLVIASATAGFNELRQLSSQYQVRVQSYQLMPYSQDEVEAFLGFYLFPDHPIGQLEIPSTLRKQLGAARGIVGQVIDIAEQEGGQVSTSPLAESESIRRGSWVIVTVLSLIAVMAGLVWYFQSQPEMRQSEVISEQTMPADSELTGVTEESGLDTADVVTVVDPERLTGEDPDNSVNGQEPAPVESVQNTAVNESSEADGVSSDTGEAAVVD